MDKEEARRSKVETRQSRPQYTFNYNKSQLCVDLNHQSFLGNTAFDFFVLLLLQNSSHTKVVCQDILRLYLNNNMQLNIHSYSIELSIIFKIIFQQKYCTLQLA